jgi:hypothetical protein
MKAINCIPSVETEKISPEQSKSIKRLYCWLSKVSTTILLSIFLVMIVAPADASTGSGKNRKSECRSKQTSFSFPVIRTNKKASLYNKDHKKSRSRNYSFPV